MKFSDDAKEDLNLRKILFSILIIIAAQIALIFFGGLNWDEFHHYNLVKRLDDGTLTKTLQTFFTHFFVWTLNLPGDVVDHVRAARVVMLLCELGVLLAIYNIALKFVSKPAAAMAVLAYLSAGVVPSQAVSFRFDSPTAFCLMTALWILACSRLGPRAILSFGLFGGLAFLISIKSAFYLPVFLGFAYLRLSEASDKSAMALRILACIIASVTVAALLYMWHATHIAAPAVSAGMATLKSASSVVFSDGFIPRPGVLIIQLFIAPHVVLLILLTILLLFRLQPDWPKRIATIALLLPLLTVLFYRNSYGYYYVFLLPPVLVATACAIDRIALRYVNITVLSLILTVWGTGLTLKEIRMKQQILQAQKLTIAKAHELFPEPITYFDDVGLLGDYHRPLGFMVTGWGLGNYRRAGIPRFSRIMDEKPVPLLVVNSYVLILEMAEPTRSEFLLEEDSKALDENYIHHWGLLWVAGKVIPAGSTPRIIDIRVPGTYTLEGGGLSIDGTRYAPVDFVDLQRGQYEVAGPREAQAVLRWGENLPRPTEVYEDQALFVPHWW